MKKEVQATKSANSPDTKSKKPLLNNKAIALLVLILVLITVSVVIYFYKQSEIKKLNEAHKTEIDSLNNKATEAISKNNVNFLETIGKVFSWAARAELERQNLGQLDIMMTELVKVKNFKQIVIISSEGKVMLSTDKKFEGQGFPKIVYDMVKTDVTKTSVQENGDILATAPIFGLDKRIGSLIITFVPEKSNFLNKTNK
jgi:ABC-type multidrug transport system fused ATPase/permease subunit